MPPPEARIRIGDCDVLVVGTIAGFVPDAERVAVAFSTHAPDRVALGIPPEDIAALRVLAASEAPAALIGKHQEPPRKKRHMTDPGMGAAGIDALSNPHARDMPVAVDDEAPIAGLDASSVRLLELLSRFGPTRIPSPDLEAAHRLADSAGVALVAIDLDDAAHAIEFTARMKVRHLLGANRRERRLLARPFDDAADAYALAVAWDAEQMDLRPLAALEALRERHMAVRIRELAARSSRLLAILPAARMPGILAALGQGI